MDDAGDLDVVRNEDTRPALVKSRRVLMSQCRDMQRRGLTLSVGTSRDKV